SSSSPTTSRSPPAATAGSISSPGGSSSEPAPKRLSAPVDAAEAVLAEQRVVDPDRVPDLLDVLSAGEARVAAVADVADRDRVLATQAPGERGVEADDVVVAATRCRRDLADEVLATGDVERELVAVRKAQREERLRRDAVVVVAVARRAVRAADRGVADAGEAAALERPVAREPPVARRAERDRGRRDTKRLRRDVVVAAVDAPDAAVRRPGLVGLADQKAARQHVLEAVRARRRRLERELVERPPVVVVFRARQAVVDREVDLRLVAVDAVRSGGVVVDAACIAEAEPAVVRRAAAREDGAVAVVEDKPVEARRRRDRRRGDLAPDARQPTAVLEHEVRHAKERFAEKRAADAARDLVVARRVRRLAEDLPERAAGERVRRRFPVAESRRAREAVIDRALVRVRELVDVERIVVGSPAAAQLPADRLHRDVVVLLVAAEVVVGAVEEEVEADDLERRQRVVDRLRRHLACLAEPR